MFWRKFAQWITASLVAGMLAGLCAGTRGPEAAGSRNFHHDEWNSVGAVFDIKQSPDGFLWLTTSKGVLRFDGVRFQPADEVTFGATHSREIDSVFISSSGGLWLTTENAGLLFWKDGQLTEFPDRRCTPTRKQGKIIEDSDGSLWVQGAAGISHLRGQVCEAVGVKQGYPGGFAAGLLMDSRGTLWVKARKGPLLFLRKGASKFQVSSAEGISTSYAFLHEALDRTIWLSDDQGLRRVTSQPGAPRYSASQAKASRAARQFGDFAFAPDGSLWAVTDQGILRFEDVAKWPIPMATENTPGEAFTPGQGLSSDAAWKVLIDREGSVWVGTNSGLDRLRRNVLVPLALAHVQEHEFALAAGAEGALWIGNSNLPLTRVSSASIVYPFPKTVRPISIRRDRFGTIWASGAGDSHLWRSNGAGFSPVPYPDENIDAVISVAVDRNRDPWILARSGKVYRLSDGEWSNQNKALGRKAGVIGAMTDDAAGNVWFSFSDRVVQWDGAAYHAAIRVERGVSENTMSVRADRVWLGGSGGVQLFRQGHFHTLRWKEADVPGRVSGVVETRAGDLWVNGFSGVTHVPSAELSKWLNDPGYAVAAERFDELDGLPGLSGEKLPEPSVVEAPDGKVWFATTKGVASLDPATLAQNRNRMAPPVAILAIRSNEKTYASSAALTLPAGTENLDVDYTALSLVLPERVLFRYQLAGVDQGWQDAGTRRQAYYTKLRPGQYQFRAIARNNDGVWNEAGATLDFRISPAWFQTAWFRLILFAFGVALASALYRFRVRQIAAGIYARFDERMAERTRIAQELHDTLLQGFLSASMQVHVAADSLSDDSKVKPTLTRALELMRQVIDEGRNAVRGLRSSDSASLDLEVAFSRIQQEVLDAHMTDGKVDFRVVVDGPRRPLHPMLRDDVYRIGREALINAFRHAHARHIELELKYSSSGLEMLVRDDGCGIDPAMVEHGREGHWGLPGMRERAERIGASLHVMSNGPAGTEIELSVPGSVAFQTNGNGKSANAMRPGAQPRNGKSK